MRKAVFISGYLHYLSDNIKPFLNKNTDIFVHTWQDNDNKRWINKLKRYQKYCGNMSILIEKPKFERKRISYQLSFLYLINLLRSADTSSGKVIHWRKRVGRSPRWEGYGRLKALPTKNLFHWYEKRNRP